MTIDTCPVEHRGTKNLQKTVADAGRLARMADLNIDWSKVIGNLRAAGMTAKGIGRRCRMEPQTVVRLHAGTQIDPRWTQALALLDVHHDVCADQHRLDELLCGFSTRRPAQTAASSEAR